MRRLARRLFTLCSAMSLVLCVACTVLWLAGAGATRVWTWWGMYRGGGGGGGFTTFTVRSAVDSIEVTHTRNERDVPPCPPGLYYNSGGRSRGAPIGVHFSFTARAESGRALHSLSVPHWVPVLVSALLPLTSALARRRERSRQRRVAHGRCAA